MKPRSSISNLTESNKYTNNDPISRKNTGSASSSFSLIELANGRMDYTVAISTAVFLHRFCVLLTEVKCGSMMLQTQLSLAKLCAMVTMKKPNETSVQSFSLPLTTLVTDGDLDDRDPDASEKV